MAKSVLDLYELYKLVVTRGGLVEVINKKLWQEIIKGLRLPASITSAAFTLRTQYMKYLYPYEQQKENLSTQEQLQTAIETNRRESRRGNYTTYATNNESMVARSQHNSLSNTLSQLPLGLPLAIGQMDIGAQSPFVNGHPQHHPHNPQHLPPNLSSNFTEYMKRLQEQKPTTNNSIGQQQSGGTPISPSTTDTFNALELSRNLWQMSYNNKIYSGIQPSYSSTPSESPSVPTNSPEQEKALDLANSAHRSDPVSSPSASRSVSSPPSGNMKRNQDATDLSPSTSTKRVFSDEENLSESTPNSMRVMQTVTVRDNGQRELMISVELNGVTYEGVLPAKNDDASSTSSNSNTIKRSRNSES
ncbi:Protein dead ringer [Camponotus floridanus]|uniref:Protein dead ringer n=2 Tax=Camponotus floridanus TaxID=104421 RepID=E2A525_CAMFO|nr:Protein dead ringer [Camponotus floridanus]